MRWPAPTPRRAPSVACPAPSARSFRFRLGGQRHRRPARPLRAASMKYRDSRPCVMSRVVESLRPKCHRERLHCTEASSRRWRGEHRHRPAVYYQQPSRAGERRRGGMYVHEVVTVETITAIIAIFINSTHSSQKSCKSSFISFRVLLGLAYGARDI